MAQSSPDECLLDEPVSCCGVCQVNDRIRANVRCAVKEKTSKYKLKIDSSKSRVFRRYYVGGIGYVRSRVL